MNWSCAYKAELLLWHGPTKSFGTKSPNATGPKKRARAASQLRDALMQKADLYFLPVKSDDIQIKEDGEKFQVTVNYKVPVNLFVFTHELTFHAAAAGMVVH